jgi:CRP-like cAMP-binding protein
MVLAAFTGVVLNVEKPFKPGDLVRLADKFQGRVERITWRVTVIQTATNELVHVPNLLLANAIIVNLDMPDKRSRRMLEVAIDYDSSVESAERILYAAALGSGVALIGQPAVNARRMERDGVVYEVAFTIANVADGKGAEHAMIKSILERMRDAGINVTFPKTEMIHAERRAAIANRSLDTYYLVQQCRLFRGLPADLCQRIAAELVEHSFTKGTTIVRAGDLTHSMFIVGEGLAKRVHTNRDGSDLVVDRFIATESFGRRALFCLDTHAATVTAETDVLVYELTQASLVRLFAETPGLIPVMAQALAQMNWRPIGGAQAEADAIALQRRVNLYRGQIEASYGVHAGSSAPAATTKPAPRLPPELEAMETRVPSVPAGSGG